MKQENLTKYNFPKGIKYSDQRNTLLLPKRKQDPGTKNCLVIDGMNIAYQALYAYGKLSYQGKSTAIMYGFINILRPIIQQYVPAKVIVCWDGIRSEERLRLLPGYKADRKKKPKSLLRQLDRVRRLLYYLGIPQAHNVNLEGDDMIYKVVKRMENLYKVVIVSADKDFKQLINFDTSVYNPRTKYIENVFAFTAGNWGVEIPQYIDYLCLVGDTSDKIPGYPQIGEKRASSFLRMFYSVKQYLEGNGEFAGLMDKDKLKEIYRRNNLLINLGLFNKKFNKDIPIVYYKDKSTPLFKEEKYKEYCLKYGLKTSIFPKFLQPFKAIGNE